MFLGGRESFKIPRPEQNHFVCLPACHPRKIRAIILVHESIRSVAHKPRISHEDFPQILSGHALEWIPPENLQCSQSFHFRAASPGKLSALARGCCGRGGGKFNLPRAGNQSRGGALLVIEL